MSLVDASVQYRDIPGFPGYRVGDDGSVWSCWARGSRPRITTRWNRLGGGVARGHNYVWLFSPDRRRVFHYVYRLVLAVFVGPCPQNMEACHGLAGPLDDGLGNVRWDTRAENAKDRRRHGTARLGEQVHTAKLDAEKVRLIRRRRSEGYSYQQIAHELGVDTTTVWCVDKGKTWSHV